MQFGKGVSGLKQPIIFPWQKLFVHRVWLKALLKPKTFCVFAIIEHGVVVVLIVDFTKGFHRSAQGER